MKIRNGFVSNSSSSSFCIYGIYTENPEYDDTLVKKTSKVGLEVHGTSYSTCVGRSYSSIKDEETGAQFKQSVRDGLKKMGLPIEKCGTCEEAWYDG